jgi:hypothetical protein
MGIPFHTSAGLIDLIDLGPRHVTGIELADGLAKINRFGGRTAVPWSVAAHCLLVEHLCQQDDLKPWALLHDAHEAFIGDITTPALELICHHGNPDAIRDAVHAAKGKIDRVIGTAWKCAPRAMSHGIRTADWIALQAELLHFFDAIPETRDEGQIDLIEEARDWVGARSRIGWAVVRDNWLERANQLEARGMLSVPRHSDPTSTSLAG